MRPIYAALIVSIVLFVAGTLAPIGCYGPHIDGVLRDGDTLRAHSWTAKNRITGVLLYENLDPSGMPGAVAEAEYRSLAAARGARLIGVSTAKGNHRFNIKLAGISADKTYLMPWVWRGGVIVGYTDVTGVILRGERVRVDHMQFGGWCLLLALLIPVVTAIISGLAINRAARRAAAQLAIVPPSM